MSDLEPVEVRAAKVLSVDEENGLIDVKIAPYEVEADLGDGYHEVFTRGAFAAAVGNPSRCKITGQQHDRDTVIGNAIALRDEHDGLYGTLRIVDTAAGVDVLKLLRPSASGHPPALDEMSVEFRPMKRHRTIQRRDDGFLVRHDKAELVGCSPVSAGAYGREARVLAVRAAEQANAQERELAYLASLTAGRRQS